MPRYSKDLLSRDQFVLLYDRTLIDPNGKDKPLKIELPGRQMTPLIVILPTPGPSQSGTTAQTTTKRAQSVKPITYKVKHSVVTSDERESHSTITVVPKTKAKESAKTSTAIQQLPKKVLTTSSCNIVPAKPSASGSQMTIEDLATVVIANKVIIMPETQHLLFYYMFIDR